MVSRVSGVGPTDPGSVFPKLFVGVEGVDIILSDLLSQNFGEVVVFKTLEGALPFL